MSVEEAIRFQRSLESPTAYSERALRFLYEQALKGIAAFPVVLEVGCEFGHSTTVLAHAVRERCAGLVCIDPFVTNVESGPGPKFLAAMLKLGYPFTLHVMRTRQTGTWMLPSVIGFLHVDGGHEEDEVSIDCETLLWRVAVGGRAAFHDYGHDSLPGVMKVADEFTAGDGWRAVGTVDTCHIVERLK